MIDDDVLAFIRSSIKSVWALELLLLLRRHRERGWGADELVREMRSSRVVVSEILVAFRQAGLVAVDADGTYRYAPANAEIDWVAGKLEKAYGERPMAIVKAIITAPNEKLQTFADAFKLRKDH